MALESSALADGGFRFGLGDHRDRRNSRSSLLSTPVAGRDEYLSSLPFNRGTGSPEGDRQVRPLASRLRGEPQSTDSEPPRAALKGGGRLSVIGDRSLAISGLNSLPPWYRLAYTLRAMTRKGGRRLCFAPAGRER
jgi:hypothetical protein